MRSPGWDGPTSSAATWISSAAYSVPAAAMPAAAATVPRPRDPAAVRLSAPRARARSRRCGR